MQSDTREYKYAGGAQLVRCFAQHSLQEYSPCARLSAVFLSVVPSFCQLSRRTLASLVLSRRRLRSQCAYSSNCHSGPCSRCLAPVHAFSHCVSLSTRTVALERTRTLSSRSPDLC